jgi:hypothetical protein
MSTLDPIAPPDQAGGRADVGRPTDSERAAAVTLLPSIWGTHISRSVYAVAELGIADLLANGPASSSALALNTGTHEPSLYRVLRLLAAIGVFTEVEPRVFSLTVLGERLRSGVPAGMRSWATFLEALGGVRPFEHILETVRTGTPGFDLALGQKVFEFLAQNPENAAIFDAAMSERTNSFAPSVARGCDFSDARTVVDVGGGQGVLLVEILRSHAHLRGVLFELQTVAARAGALLDALDISDRCEVLAGDFFQHVPDGADRYLLANVIHDWDDGQAIEILSNCRRAMARGGRVLIVERLISDDLSDAVPTLLSDINMLVITGGRERTDAEYGELLAASGLTLAEVNQVAFPYGVIEGVAA